MGEYSEMVLTHFVFPQGLLRFLMNVHNSENG